MHGINHICDFERARLGVRCAGEPALEVPHSKRCRTMVAFRSREICAELHFAPAKSTNPHDRRIDQRKIGMLCKRGSSLTGIEITPWAGLGSSAILRTSRQ